MGFNRAEHCRKIAALGGKATVKKHGRGHMKKIGKKGGDALVEKYGEKWMSLIGKVGFQRTCEKYFDGDKKAMVEDFVARGLFAQDDFAREYGYQFQYPDPGPHPAHVMQEAE